MNYSILFVMQLSEYTELINNAVSEGDLAPGVYCLSVDEDLPYDIKDELEVQGVPHRVRSDPFYPAMD